MPLTLDLLPGEFAVCRLGKAEPVPAWAGSDVFSSVTRTADELSLVCPAGPVPAGIRAERGWRLLQIAGPLDFSAVGIIASITTPLAQAGISVLGVGTFDTDYVLVKAARVDQAIHALETAGHRVRRGEG
jgi:uncharacterized protein